MGYQVGRICYQTKAEAENELMTQVVPAIGKDGVLKHPVFNGKRWEYDGQTVALSLPRCEYGQNYDMGKAAGAYILETTVVLVCTIILIKAIGQIR